ncbi:DUF7344 domain-containing protein [Natronolimnobius baerhuensis]|uniref:DUF7344 domain-containing protein n=1 Tax=Natronolimnobius baerhuensis TaxID=253108 RepID=A0A202E6M8_9EURY|nr:hypothetical protein [Natronolimnobius baerhuensis]OVE83921.1 hypothetical protein B2G88_16045 [Natronolimnobius baerhuensis]
MSSDVHLGGSSEHGPLGDVPTDQYDVLRHPRRVRLLEYLETDTRCSLTELTTALLEHETVDAPMGEARHNVRLTLVHNHLPRLAAAGLLDWDRDDGVKLVEDPVLCPAALSTLLETAADEDELLERVVHPGRLHLLESLASADSAQSLAEIATALAGQVPALPADVEHTKIELHHSHLPALDDVGAIEYDHEEHTIVSTEKTASITLIR